MVFSIFGNATKVLVVLSKNLVRQLVKITKDTANQRNLSPFRGAFCTNGMLNHLAERDNIIKLRKRLLIHQSAKIPLQRQGDL
ncbi:MAG TPA: hypothetical protein DCY72_07060 [Ruminococcaceae bacterium]|nr:hypothetical protein [Oscillospiraceae bacterium]